MFNSPYLLTF
jgi:serine/threonine protein kinase